MLKSNALRAVAWVAASTVAYTASAGALASSNDGARLPAVVHYGEATIALFDAASVRTRADVRAEAVAAMARGEVQYGEAGPAFPQTPSALTRMQVRAELMEALRLGLHSGNEASAPIPTAEQQALISAAGRAAAAPKAASLR